MINIFLSLAIVILVGSIILLHREKVEQREDYQKLLESFQESNAFNEELKEQFKKVNQSLKDAIEVNADAIAVGQKAQKLAKDYEKVVQNDKVLIEDKDKEIEDKKRTISGLENELKIAKEALNNTRIHFTNKLTLTRSIIEELSGNYIRLDKLNSFVLELIYKNVFNGLTINSNTNPFIKMKKTEEGYQPVNYKTGEPIIDYDIQIKGISLNELLTLCKSSDITGSKYQKLFPISPSMEQAVKVRETYQLCLQYQQSLNLDDSLKSLVPNELKELADRTFLEFVPNSLEVGVPTNSVGQVAMNLEEK